MTYVLIYLFIGIELCILCLLSEFRRSPDATTIWSVVLKTTSVFVMFWPWMFPFYVYEYYWPRFKIWQRRKK